ncbi:DNA helicase [Myxococcus phage Mx1]|nr:DNA helicase [Myxococcus phage Mx1]
MFTPNEGQRRFLDAAKALQKKSHKRPHILVLAGPAGTGKTAVLRFLLQEIGEVQVITPTGMSAQRVIESTGILDAKTAHRWMYVPEIDPFTGEVRFVFADPAKMRVPESRTIVLDEASMVGEDLWNDIYETAEQLQCHIICVGDPFQLPPVDDKQYGPGEEPFSLLSPNFAPPDNVLVGRVELTEIMRQALEGPGGTIIKASKLIRQGRADEGMMLLPRINRDQLMEKHVQTYESGGVLICHRNVTRHELNRRFRAHKKLPEKGLVEGEPLLVLKNTYELNRFNGELLRFETWDRPPGKRWEIYDRYKSRLEHSTYGIAQVSGQKCGLAMEVVLGRLDGMNINSVEKTAKTANGKDCPYLHANFGYTLTAHKSQGNEWKSVIVIVEKSVRVWTTLGRRWLYTAVTRAKERCDILWLGGNNDVQII